MSLLKKYKDSIQTELQKELNYKNVMQVPKLIKIILSRGLGKSLTNKKLLEEAIDELTRITGQRAVKTFAKKSIANFKIREGYPIGAKVTLRGKKMYEFLNKLINVCLPRVRDFQGLMTKSFDSRGNYSLSIKEQIIFPEIDYNKISQVTGLNICIVTSSKSDTEAKILLEKFNMPFQKGIKKEN